MHRILHTAGDAAPARIACYDFAMVRAMARQWISTGLPALALVACGAGEHDSTSTAAVGTCTIVDASPCPGSGPPSYPKDIAPLIDKECNRACHAPGLGPWPLTTYQDVADWSVAIQDDVRGCTMPPRDAGTLSSRDRATLLDWLACGHPRN